MSRLGSNYDAYARVPICRACDNPFVPPGYDGCCSVRCTQYLEVAHQPVLGDPTFCQRDEPIQCWGCQVSFMSRGIRYCPECYFKARPLQSVQPFTDCNNPSIGPGVGVDLTQRGQACPDCNSRSARHDEPISDRTPRDLYRWRRLDESEA